MKAGVPLKKYQKHLGDWQEGYPTWKDGNNVWPFIKRDEKLHYDCSKLDQWAVVFDFATEKGMHLHFKLQENEMDDNSLLTGASLQNHWDKSWEYAKIALDFFQTNIPFQDMKNADALLGNTTRDKGKYWVKWFNPRTGGDFLLTEIKKVKGGKVVDLGKPPVDDGEDWLVVITQ